ncbi:ABC transporter permease subunit [Plantactinospora solaniradicis]|uniref:ABC transporter permease subunit n=1 Tax=Plantactinospora solaniradicis TaxID=1723736 RepID=A0ABW1KFX8_9ACTN
MIWLTWRQFRIQAWTALAALAALAVALMITGPELTRLYRSSGLAGCRTDCESLASGFLNQVINGTTGPLYWLGIAVMFVTPAIIGVFWGAPLVARELETGTHRLVWSQSVPRGRWLAVKLLCGGLVSMAAVGLFSLAVTWWADPIDSAYLNRMFPEIFAARGIVPIGYAAFAFVVGVTVGMLLRRTVPAMAVTLVVVAAAQLAMPFLVRGHLIQPVEFTTPFQTTAVKSLQIHDDGTITVTGRVSQPGAWVVSNRTVTPSGVTFTGPVNTEACSPTAFSQAGCMAWLDTLNLRQEAAYQPANRFWALQWYEATVLLALALALAGFSSWWIRRRLA